MTFFFCLPPPDLVGLEDGGGAFSFLGACKQNQTYQHLILKIHTTLITPVAEKLTIVAGSF